MHSIVIYFDTRRGKKPTRKVEQEFQFDELFSGDTTQEKVRCYGSMAALATSGACPRHPLARPMQLLTLLLLLLLLMPGFRQRLQTACRARFGRLQQLLLCLRPDWFRQDVLDFR